MKQQLTTLTKLQEEVCKIHLSHKQKFEETKELVLKVSIMLNYFKQFFFRCTVLTQKIFN